MVSDYAEVPWEARCEFSLSIVGTKMAVCALYSLDMGSAQNAAHRVRKVEMSSPLVPVPVDRGFAALSQLLFEQRIAKLGILSPE